MRQIIRGIHADCLLMKLTIKKAHRTLHCGLRINAYVAQVHLSGFSGTGVRAWIQEEIGLCSKCSSTKLIMSGTSELAKQPM